MGSSKSSPPPPAQDPPPKGPIDMRVDPDKRAAAQRDAVGYVDEADEQKRSRRQMEITKESSGLSIG